MKGPKKFSIQKMDPSKISKLQIRNYTVEDYYIVREIFANGIGENMWPAWRRSWNGERPKTLTFHLSFVLLCGFVSIYLSTWMGIVALLVYQTIHITYLHKFYYGYAEYAYLFTVGKT